MLIFSNDQPVFIGGMFYHTIGQNSNCINKVNCNSKMSRLLQFHPDNRYFPHIDKALKDLVSNKLSKFL